MSPRSAAPRSASIRACGRRRRRNAGEPVRESKASRRGRGARGPRRAWASSPMRTLIRSWPDTGCGVRREGCRGTQAPCAQGGGPRGNDGFRRARNGRFPAFSGRRGHTGDNIGFLRDREPKASSAHRSEANASGRSASESSPTTASGGVGCSRPHGPRRTWTATRPAAGGRKHVVVTRSPTYASSSAAQAHAATTRAKNSGSGFRTPQARRGGPTSRRQQRVPEPAPRAHRLVARDSDAKAESAHTLETVEAHPGRGRRARS